MPRPQLLVIVLLALFVSAGSAQNTSKKPDRKGKLAIEKVELDRTKVILPCPPGQRPRSESCNDSSVIVAKVVAPAIKAKEIELYTTVSAGRIVKKVGAEIQWDLAGVYPGTYTISVAVPDEKGVLSDPVTRTVEIVECPACGYHDACPTLDLNDPQTVEAGELMEFTVKVSAMPGDPPTYNWTVSDGTIESGQGTPTIKVRTNESMAGQSITATIVLGNVGNSMMCTTTAVATGAVVARKPQ